MLSHLVGAALVWYADSTVFRVAVLDEAGAPVAGASIAIMDAVSVTLASRVTGESGLETFVIRRASGEVQLSVQRIGYTPYRQFYRLGVSDTVVAQVALRPLAQRLDPQRVTARENSKRRIYHVDADEVLASGQSYEDALDIVRRLRPAMFGDRLRGLRGCGFASTIWVNGRRIVFPPDNDSTPPKPLPRTPMKFVGERTVRQPDGKTRRVRMYEPVAPSGEAAAAGIVRSVLSAIAPEHISEMTYLDCFDNSMASLHTNNAIFVVLKMGVGYDDKRGSYVVGDSTKR